MQTQTRNPEARSAGHARQAGSAYVAVLVVLVVLTILALALSLITQTEMQVGSNERTISRVFYSADSGTQVGLTHVLINHDFSPRTYIFTDTGVQLVKDQKEFGTQVKVSSCKIADAVCALCEINQAGYYGNKDKAKTIISVASTAERFATIDAGDQRTPLAQKRISVMYELQPFDKVIVPESCNY